MTHQDSDLHAALLAAFPPAPITRATIEAPDARFEPYDERTELAQLEDKPWTALEPATLVHHAALLTYAGGALYRAVLPAYLAYLLDHTVYNEVPFHVGGQLTRKASPIDQQIFDERVGPLTAEQRAVVRRVVEQLATREPMQAVMSAALQSW